MKKCHECGVIILDVEDTCPSCSYKFYKDQKQNVVEELAISSNSYKEKEFFIPSTKKVIVSKEINSSNFGVVKIALGILCLMPIINVIGLIIFMQLSKPKYELRRTVRVLLYVSLSYSILVLLVLAKFNFSNAYYFIRDYIRTVLHSISK